MWCGADVATAASTAGAMNASSVGLADVARMNPTQCSARYDRVCAAGYYRLGRTWEPCTARAFVPVALVAHGEEVRLAS